jgi:hypothetical protein
MYKNSDPVFLKKESISNAKMKNLMQFGDTFGIYFENQLEYTNTFFFSSSTLYEFWLAQLFLSIVSSLASSVSSSSLPSFSGHFSRRLPILISTFLSVLLRTISIYI